MGAVGPDRTRPVRPPVVVATIVAGALAVLAVSWLLDDDRTVREERYGWTAEVPDGWDVAPFEVPEPYPDRPTRNTGLVFTSYAIDGPGEPFRAPPGMPANGAAIVVAGGAATPDAHVRGGPFPLALAGDRRVGDDYVGFAANGYGFEVIAYYGAAIGDDTMRAVARLVASIRFPSLPDPPRGQGIWRDGTIVLGPAERFPDGTLTPVEVPIDGETEVFVVARAPDLTYLLVGFRDGCALTIGAGDGDGETIEDCRGIRWNRVGEPLGRGRPLNAFYATADWDGDLVASLDSLAYPLAW